MKIDILTLFPEMFKGPFDHSILKRAQKKKLVEIKIHNLRKWTKDKHQTADDKPYGGGVGMVMMVEPIFKALLELKSEARNPKSEINPNIKIRNFKQKVVLLTPQGKVFNQKKAQQLSTLDHLILICGHYEGVDERVSKHLVDEEISIGDYILTGGEIPAMVIVDSLVRLIPGVLKNPLAVKNESFSHFSPLTSHFPILEPPQYTRPENFKGWNVPKILLSGNHQEIEKWQAKQALIKTKLRRPGLLSK